MHILITGGLGFIGSHLTAKLLSDGHKVVVIDSGVFSSDYLRQTRCLTHKHLKVIKGDVRQSIHISRGEIDQIYHLACVADPDVFLHNQERTFSTTVLGTYAALNAARKAGIPILIASSSEIYGTDVASELYETMNGSVSTFSSRACYAEGKRAGETISFIMREMGNDVRVVRIFNCYGPGMRLDDGRVITRFIYEALRDEPLILFGGGRQTRSFCYVDDTVDGLIAVMGGEASLPLPVNLGNPNEEHTIATMAKKIIRMTGSRSRVVKAGLRPEDTAKRKPCIDLISSMYNWKPTISLDEGLEKTIAWYRTIL